ncbi:MAG TPA: hypothetical protein EYG03_22135 [Planctomycetes bacterium]|nr:hypothetical protein [Fuerstiella sp.]HIK94652.1 hypothetical protein [Planctomycetota bacterium]
MANNRKKHLVDGSLQGAILLPLVMHWALFVVVAGALLYFIELNGGAPRDAGRNLMSLPDGCGLIFLSAVFRRAARRHLFHDSGCLSG